MNRENLKEWINEWLEVFQTGVNTYRGELLTHTDCDDLVDLLNECYKEIFKEEIE